MAEYIMTILHSQLMVVFSWGFYRPTALPDNRGLAFQVEGFKYTGTVKVIYNEGVDLFEIYLDNGQNEKDVYLDQLVNVIDGMVERCDNYDKRISDAYSIY